MYRTPRTNKEGPSMFLAPVLALGMWNPFLTEALRGNAQANEGFGAIASEWQEFLGRRMKEDMALMQRLTKSRTPDQILAAYTDFWQKAGEDYGNEITTLFKLMAGVTTTMTAAVQSDTDDARRKYVFHSSQAA
jgi:hypothetical protein